MPPRSKNIALFGSTGSIGRNALDVIAASDGRHRAAALSANRNFELLVEQSRRFRPDWVVAVDAQAAEEFDFSGLPAECHLLVGPEGLDEVAAKTEIDVVLAAIVGGAGLRSTWAAVDAGKTVALANKETLVVAGSLVTRRAAETGAKLIPVDSEHSAIFQAMLAGRPGEVRRVILTASGGPFLDRDLDSLEHVAPAEALEHPTWDMGPKITVDSATMMNKALEVIEAHWLFGLDPDQIDVVVHPQSIVHSMVEFVDGSVVAQLSPPDMRLPIQYAFDYPDRRPGIALRVDFSRRVNLQFLPPDAERFPALALGYEAARRGGTAGAALNGAGEAAVAGFLNGGLKFTEIVPACRRVLQEHSFDPNPTLQRLAEIDRQAREEVSRWALTS